MKKIFVTLFALLALSMSMPAQNVEFSKDANLAFGNEVFFVEPISYLGFGYHLKNQTMDDAQNAFNSEFFVNIMELGFCPTKHFMIALGVDYDMDTYRVDKNHFWRGVESANMVLCDSKITLPNGTDVKSSTLRVHTFAIPLSFEFRAGKSAFRLGAAGEYNLPAVSKLKTVKDSEVSKLTTKGIAVNEFTYSFFGSISYGGLGVYAKYSPAYQFPESKGPHFNTITIGAVLGLGM